LDHVSYTALTAPPAWVNEPFERPGKANLTEDEKKALQKERNEHAQELRGWWLEEMRITPSPLTEKMTLFWHNHFVSGLDKVGVPQLMYQQNVLLRKQAVGNFGQLLHAIARDPAMMRYLDTVNNRKGQPNENFAREVMELFTLGEGHYSEQDIREAARAFTGWSLDKDFQFVYRPNLHDNGDKTIFGQQGNFDGDDVLDMLLRKPQTARFVTLKLWKYLVSPPGPSRHPAPVRPVLPRQLRNPPAAACHAADPGLLEQPGPAGEIAARADRGHAGDLRPHPAGLARAGRA
jgi:uncharacterized protein (DUF1800 family)